MKELSLKFTAIIFGLLVSGCDSFPLNTNKNISNDSLNYQNIEKSDNKTADDYFKDGMVYYKSLFSKESYEMTESLFTKAAEMGHAEAQYSLGQFLSAQKNPPDPVKASFWFKKAAEQNHAKAQNAIGLAYFYGKGVEKNENTAIYWLTQASNQGFEVSQLELAKIYEKNNNIDQSLFWYEKAAKQGNRRGLFEILSIKSRNSDAESQFKLAEMFESGDAVIKDNNQAINLYKQSAMLGYLPAKNKLAILYKQEETQRKEQEAQHKAQEAYRKEQEKLNIIRLAEEKKAQELRVKIERLAINETQLDANIYWHVSQINEKKLKLNKLQPGSAVYSELANEIAYLNRELVPLEEAKALIKQRENDAYNRKLTQERDFQNQQLQQQRQAQQAQADHQRRLLEIEQQRLQQAEEAEARANMQQSFDRLNNTLRNINGVNCTRFGNTVNCR